MRALRAAYCNCSSEIRKAQSVTICKGFFLQSNSLFDGFSICNKWLDVVNVAQQAPTCLRVIFSLTSIPHLRCFLNIIIKVKGGQF